MDMPSQTLKRLLTRTLLSSVLMHALAQADTNMSAEQIRAKRELAQQQKESLATSKLTTEQLAARQTTIDSEVRANFQKRIQMRPSDAAKIPPECDEWLKLYQETGSEEARQGIKQTCP
ncbi:hypothetical protein [Pseudomonas panipatensis]|uniref:hypothetical protein n=1 Tax=Pseudomonas panipatensis TaxID=428992 RepID=UPI0035ADFEF6